MVAVACYVVKILLHQIRYAQGCDGVRASCHQFRDDERTAAEQGVFRFVADGDGLTREGFGKFVEHEVEIAGRLHRAPAQLEFQLPVETAKVTDLLADTVGAQEVLVSTEWNRMKVQLPSNYATILRLKK